MDNFLKTLQEKFGGEIRGGRLTAPAGWTAEMVEGGVRFDYPEHEQGFDMDAHQILPLIAPDVVMLDAKAINERCEQLQRRKQASKDKRNGK